MRVRVHLWEMTLRSRVPSAMPLLASVVSQPPLHAPLDILLPTSYEARVYAPPPLLYLFIEQAAVLIMRVRCTVTSSVDSTLSPCWRIPLLPLALDVPLGMKNNAVLVPTSGSCRATHLEL